MNSLFYIHVVFSKSTELLSLIRARLSPGLQKLIGKPHAFYGPHQPFFTFDPGDVLPVLTSSLFVFRHESPPRVGRSYRSYLGHRTDNRGGGRVAGSGHYRVKRAGMIYGTSTHSGEADIFEAGRGREHCRARASLDEGATGARIVGSRELALIAGEGPARKIPPLFWDGSSRQPIDTFRVAPPTRHHPRPCSVHRDEAGTNDRCGALPIGTSVLPTRTAPPPPSGIVCSVVPPLFAEPGFGQG